MYEQESCQGMNTNAFIKTSFNLISKVSHELGIHKKYKDVNRKYTSLRLNQRSNNMLNTSTKTYNLATLKIQHSTYDGHSTRKTLQYCLRRASSRHVMIRNQQGKYQIEKNQVLDRRCFQRCRFPPSHRMREKMSLLCNTESTKVRLESWNEKFCAGG